ncbi:hypothetical protein RFI_09705 [Reticulomyxa filosa]|uniref:Uncharacterized protein n=1 Tax=Reticulomyxa filosa TaxID=46433 RepID=X6NP25_RETFI|nr:hypothetical protein RFI_09705 [Reticulomyxa filosa]|eukprot:ETO27429.1 hypothetical protein RFI_09705 [Reticulomyxa filosa]
MVSNTQPCADCGGYDGVTCAGGENLTVELDWWAYVQNHNDSVSELAAASCPTGYCCQRHRGCNYATDTKYICASNRNSSVPLCGACNDGFSELLGTAACGACEEPQTWLVLVPIIFGFVFMIYLAFAARYKDDWVSVLQTKNELIYVLFFYFLFFLFKKKKKAFYYDCVCHPFIFKIDRLKLSSSMAQLMFFKPLTYYFQSLSYVLVQGGITLWLSPLLSVFEFQWNGGNGQTGGDHNEGGICIIKGLTSKGEILLQAFTPALFLCQLTILFGLYRLCGKKNEEQDRPQTFCGLLPKFSIAFWQVILLCLGTFITVALRFLACRRIKDVYSGHGNIDILFFAGDSHCLGWYWYLALLFLLLSVCVCARGLLDTNLNDGVYWEFVIVARRVGVALFATVQTYDTVFFNLCLILTLMCCLCGQLVYSPFQDMEINILEGLSIFCLLAIVIGVNFLTNKPSHFSDEFIHVCISIFIIVPFVVFVYFIFNNAYTKKYNEAMFVLTSNEEMVEMQLDEGNKKTVDQNTTTRERVESEQGEYIEPEMRTFQKSYALT